MPPETLNAWIALYMLVGVCALLCAIGALIQTSVELVTGSWRPSTDSAMRKLVALPRIWLRWQIHYFKGTPVILLIAGAFIWTEGASVFLNV